MSPSFDTSADWAQDRRGLASDPQLLSQLAHLLEVPTPPHSTWRAATVALFATNPLGVVAAYHQHVQDLEWPVSEESLIAHTITLLHHRATNTQPI